MIMSMIGVYDYASLTTTRLMRPDWDGVLIAPWLIKPTVLDETVTQKTLAETVSQKTLSQTVRQKTITETVVA